MLESLGEVCQHPAPAKDWGLSPEARLLFHPEHSQKIMDDLHQWMSPPLEQKLVEPNSGLGQAFSDLLKHWDPLTGEFGGYYGAPDNALMSFDNLNSLYGLRKPSKCNQ